MVGRPKMCHFVWGLAKMRVSGVGLRTSLRLGYDWWSAQNCAILGWGCGNLARFRAWRWGLIGAFAKSVLFRPVISEIRLSVRLRISASWESGLWGSSRWGLVIGGPVTGGQPRDYQQRLVEIPSFLPFAPSGLNVIGFVWGALHVFADAICGSGFEGCTREEIWPQGKIAVNLWHFLLSAARHGAAL